MKNQSLKNKIFVMALAFVMVFTGLGIGSWGVGDAWADSSDVTVTYSFVSGDAFDFEPHQITVKAGTAAQYGIGKASTSPTLMDAIVTAHVIKYSSDFTSENVGDYLNETLSKIFGKSGFAGHAINGHYSADYASEYLLRDNDIIEMFMYEDDCWGDVYATFRNSNDDLSEPIKDISFKKDEGSVYGELYVKGFMYMGIYGDQTEENLVSAIEGLDVSIYASDNLSQPVSSEMAYATPTDVNGKTEIKFNSIGEYVIKVTGTDDYDSRVIPAWCKITVSKNISDIQKAQNIANAINWNTIKSENLDKYNIISSLNLPANIDDANITWEISDNNYLGNDGNVVKYPTVEEGSKPLTIKATIKVNDASVAKYLYAVMGVDPKAKQSILDINQAINGVAEYLTADQPNRIKDWWVAIGLSRYKELNPETDKTISNDRKQALVDASIDSIIKANVGSGVGTTESSAANQLMNSINLLSALGYRVTDLLSLNKTEVDAVSKLARVDVNKAKEGWYITLAAYALVAFNQGDYSTETSEDNHIDYLLDNYDEEQKGWSMKWGVDTTAMVIQGLAPYYNKNAEVKKAIDSAIDAMSAKQKDTGTFGNAASDAMVVIALCQLGINPDTDTRFIKKDVSILDALLSKYNSEKQNFGNDSNTKQGFLALITALKTISTGSAYNPYDFSSAPKIQAIALSEGSTSVPQTPTEGKDITVSFSMKSDNGYWISNKSVTVKEGSTVYNAFVKAIEGQGITAKGAESGYVSSITKDTTTLAEFTKGPNSGWLYKVNGKLPDVGLTSYKISNGDSILWYYTDDWTKDSDAGVWAPTTVTTTTTTQTPAKVTGDAAAAALTQTAADKLITDAVSGKSDQIKVEVTSTGSAAEINLQLTKKLLTDMIDKTSASLVITAGDSQITLDREALKSVISQTKGDTIEIIIKKIKSPSESMTTLLGDKATIFELTVKSGDTIISTFGGGKLKLELPYSGTFAKPILVCVGADNKLEKFSSTVVTSNGKKILQATVTHLSTYAIMDETEADAIIKAQAAEEGKKADNSKLIAGVKSTKVVSLKAKTTKSKVTLTWKKSNSGYKVDGYQIWKSTKKTSGFKKVFTTTKKSYKNTKDVKAGTTYWYKVRGYRKVDGKTIYTPFIKIKAVAKK